MVNTRLDIEAAPDDVFAVELRASHPDWANRVDDHQLLVHDKDVRAMAERAGVVFVGYRALRDLQRAA